MDKMRLAWELQKRWQAGPEVPVHLPEWLTILNKQQENM